ncbi:MAG: dTDP-4-dehydrorhamnose reductase [Acidaminococcaceae bacterium]|nr:dTDP-4-dehydrorhamnose reductase [Acidaminococcaceae bacterium]
MRVLVTGAAGQLGSAVCAALGRRGMEYWGLSSKELDVRDRDAVNRTIRELRPEGVVHCAAYTAVDRAETEEAECRAVNVSGTENVAKACRDSGAKLLYISSDYVFSGVGTEYAETGQPTAPLNAYGRSKADGESAVLEYAEKHFILRSSWFFCERAGNFADTMLRLSEKSDQIRVVSDQTGSPTYTADLALLICDMILSDRYGIYHGTNEGVCSWAEFASEIFRIAGKKTRVIPISASEYAAAACRPGNSRLSKASLDAAGFRRLPDWHDALARCLALRKEMERI